MDLAALKMFLAVAQERSFSRAAAILARAYRLGDQPELHAPVHDYIRLEAK